MELPMKSVEGTRDQIMTEIREANLNYLMLAQQMIRFDKAAAVFRLGVSEQIADLLESLSNSQLIKLASSSMMLTRFRFEDAAMLGMLTSEGKAHSQSLAHSAILMAAQPVEAIY
jgi:flagellar transcriptional activator FlhD